MSRSAVAIYMFSVCAVAISLRLFQINSHSFWLDEAYSWTMATKYSFVEIIQRTATDFHPPLYFVALKCWIRVSGDSEVAQRLLSVTFDILTLPMLYLLCRDAFADTNSGDGKNDRTGVLAASMYAVSGIHIQWASETRMYSMATLLSAASSWTLLRGLTSSLPRWWILYTVSATALLYTHNYGIFTVFGQAICLTFVFLGRMAAARSNRSGKPQIEKEPRMILALVSCTVIGITYLPWLSILLKQTLRARADYWIPDLNWWTIPRTWLDLLIHENIPVEERNSALALGVSLMSLMSLLYVAVRARSRGAILILSATLSPIVCSLVISIVSLPIITSRHYLSSCAFFFCVAAFVAVNSLPRESSKIVGGVLIVNMLYLYFSFHEGLQISANCGMRAAVRHLAQDFRDGDTIVVADQAMLLSARYYVSHLLQPKHTMPDRSPKLLRSVQLINWLGAALIDDRDRISAAELSEKSPRRLWVIDDASNSPSEDGEFSTAKWKEKSRVSFQGNYYFERRIRVWLFIPQ